MPFRPPVSRPLLQPESPLFPPSSPTPSSPTPSSPTPSSPTPSCDRTTASPPSASRAIPMSLPAVPPPPPLTLSPAFFTTTKRSPVPTAPPSLGCDNAKPLLDAVSCVADEVRSLHQRLCVESQRAVAYRAAESKCSGGEKGGDGEGEDCPICLEKMRTPGSSLTRCGHMFHTHCILQHLENRSKVWCPLCRRELMRGELTAVMSGIPEGDGEEQRGDKGGEDEVGKGAYEKLGQAVESVVKVMKDGKKLKGLMQRWEKERGWLREQWQAEVEERREQVEADARAVKKEQARVDVMKRDCLHERSEVEARMTEANDHMAAVIKMRGEVEMIKRQLHEEREALGRDRQQMAEERLAVRKRKERLEKLLTIKEGACGTTGGGKAGRDLKKENERLRKQVAELKKETQAQSKDMSGVFGETLQRPSSLNRPSAPRRRGASLSGFVPKRSKVQQPGMGIGER